MKQNKKVVRLTEGRLRRLITNSIVRALNEGRNADKARANTLQVIRSFFNNASWLDNEFEDEAANPNHLLIIDYIENKLKEICFHANIPDSVIRLEPIIMNIALQLGFEQENQDQAKLNRLFRIVNYITKCVKEKVELPIQLNKLNLDNTTYETLDNLFGKVLDSQDAEESQRIGNADYSEGVNPNYEILSDIDYETAHRYGDHSCSNSKLCYTQSESTWKQYTRDGMNTVYLLLRKDWQNVPEEHGEDTPYDDYGLSMIFLFVDRDGDLAYSNTRWNHRTNGKGPSNVDQSFTKEQISKLLNVNFNQVFKPISEWERRVNDALQRLKNGETPKDVFDYYSVFSEGYAAVRLNRKWNFIDTEGNLVSPNQWFDECRDFVNGYAAVSLNGKENFIDTEGNLVSPPNQWFDKCYFFKEGYAVVNLNKKENFIDTEGNILFPNQWFDMCSSFHEGYARVYLRGKDDGYNSGGIDNWIDPEGNLYDRKTKQPLGINVNNQNESVKKALVNMVVEKIMRQILMQ